VPVDQHEGDTCAFERCDVRGLYPPGRQEQEAVGPILFDEPAQGGRQAAGFGDLLSS
jgi:hypothetical protein